MKHFWNKNDRKERQQHTKHHKNLLFMETTWTWISCWLSTFFSLRLSTQRAKARMSYDKVVVDKRCTYYLLTWFYTEHQTKRFLDKIYEISWKTNDDDNVKNKNFQLVYAHPCIGSSFVLMLSARVFVSGCRRRPLTNSLQLRVARLHTHSTTLYGSSKFCTLCWSENDGEPSGQHTEEIIYLIIIGS